VNWIYILDYAEDILKSTQEFDLKGAGNTFIKYYGLCNTQYQLGHVCFPFTFLYLCAAFSNSISVTVYTRSINFKQW